MTNTNTNTTFTLDTNTKRAMTRDSILSTVDEFLDSWLATIVANATVFPQFSQYSGNALLRYVREAIRLMDSQPQSSAAVKGAKGAKVRASVLNDKGEAEESKLFDSYYQAERWCARRVADLPHYSGNVGGKLMTRDDAISLAWGGRTAQPVTKSSTPSVAGWVTKCQQTKVTFSKG